MILSYEITKKDVNKTVKQIAKSELNLSTRLLNKLKNMQLIKLNDKPAMVNELVKEGDLLTVDFNYNEEDNIISQEGKLEVLYEDDWYLAVNKKAHLCVHPSSFHPDSTLANYVKAYLKNSKKIRPVNRLDNGTSGICLFAKNEYAQELFNLYKNDVQKEYIAICEGFFNEKSGKIVAPIARKEESIIERTIDFKEGQEAITNYEVLGETYIENEAYSLVKFVIETGRTHQIRVHSVYINHPILGDSLYGKVSNLISRQALHAKKLCFRHFLTKEMIIIEAPFEQDFFKLFLAFNVDKKPKL